MSWYESLIRWAFYTDYDKLMLIVIGLLCITAGIVIANEVDHGQ